METEEELRHSAGVEKERWRGSRSGPGRKRRGTRRYMRRRNEGEGKLQTFVRNDWKRVCQQGVPNNADGKNGAANAEQWRSSISAHYYVSARHS
jgi:hypothetical protein